MACADGRLAPVAKALIFAAFVALAGVATRRHQSTVSRRLRVNLLLQYATAVSLLVGLSGREAWPFSSWPMDNGLVPADFRFLAPIAVDARGHETPIDPRAFEPLAWVDVTTWLAGTRPMDTAVARDVGPYLLATVRSARRRAAGSDDVGRYHRWLGMLAAPNTQLSPDRWTDHSAILPDSVVQLRVYQYRADLDGPVVAKDQLPRTLVFQHPVGPP